MKKYLLLVTFSVCFLFSRAQSLKKVPISNSGCSVYTFCDFKFEKDYSEDTAHKIDEEIHALVHESYDRAKSLISEHRDKLDMLAARLIEKETIDIEEARVLLNIPEHKSTLHQDAS